MIKQDVFKVRKLRFIALSGVCLFITHPGLAGSVTECDKEKEKNEYLLSQYNAELYLSGSKATAMKRAKWKIEETKDEATIRKYSRHLSKMVAAKDRGESDQEIIDDLYIDCLSE